MPGKKKTHTSTTIKTGLALLQINPIIQMSVISVTAPLLGPNPTVKNYNCFSSFSPSAFSVESPRTPQKVVGLDSRCHTTLLPASMRKAPWKGSPVLRTCTGNICWLHRSACPRCRRRFHVNCQVHTLDIKGLEMEGRTSVPPFCLQPWPN